MASSTLPSKSSAPAPVKSRVPSLALKLLGAALAAWAVGVVFTLWINPETRFFKAAAHTKQEWARKMTREHGAKFLVCGASSTTFGIDGARLLERYQLPVVNMGVTAGVTPRILTEWALSETRPGDTLVVAIEPGLLTIDQAATATAVQFCYALNSPQWLRGVLEPHESAGPASWLMLRPGGQQTFTYLAKLFGGQPLYRYRVADLQPSGLVTTAVRTPLTGSPGYQGPLPAASRHLLRSLADWSRTNQVRLCYALYWAWCPPEYLEAFRRQNAAFLVEISEFMPVLEDRRLGAVTNQTLFADTALHLTAEGVPLRTDALGEQLRAGRMWDTNELRTLARP